MAVTIGSDNEDHTNATIHHDSTGIGADPTDTGLQVFKDVYYYDTIAGVCVNVNLDWRWNDLLQGSSSVYDGNLAKMGLALSAAIEGSTDEAAEILIGKNYDKATGLGCDTVQFSPTSPGAMFGHRSIIESDGETEHIIFVVLRGTTSFEDDLNDIWTAMGIGDWGFGGIYRELLSCISEWSQAYGDINSSNTKFFVAGHSLGGACANILSAQLSKDYGAENVFGYTYAAPSPYTSEISDDYKNIHNFLCYRDNVPSRLSTQDPWYGNGYYTWFSPDTDKSPLTSYYYTELTGKLWSETYKEHFFFRLHAPSIYMAFLMTSPDLNNVASKVNYIRAKCPVDIEVYNSNGELVGHIVNDEVDYDNYTSDVMLTVTDGAKCVYFLNSDTYTINLIGTGDGTMVYTAASKDMNSDTVETDKVYSNVKITSSKKLKSIVSSYDTTDTSNLVEISDVELLVIDEGGNVVERVLSDNETSLLDESSGSDESSGGKSSNSRVAAVITIIVAVGLGVALLIVLKKRKREIIVH